MRKFLVIAAVLLLPLAALASQSVILDAEGYACPGDDKSRKLAEQMAIEDAKSKAAQSAATYIKSETSVKNAVLEHDLLSAYSNAQVKVVKEISRHWYKDGALGDCFRVRLNVEVVPNDKAMESLAKRDRQAAQDDPLAPLGVRVWTAKAAYAGGEKIRVFVKGNRPFYGRVIFEDASGTKLQILPNPYRKESYFNGGVVYEIPSGEDRFDLEASLPFGKERITLYASTSPTGDVDLSATGGVYEVRTADIGVATRGVKLVAKGSGLPEPASFAQASAEITTFGE